MSRTDDIALPLIAGERDTTACERHLEVVNPATEQPIAAIGVCGQAHVDAAVDAARAAQREWVALAPDRRGRLLWEWADVIKEHAEELARLDSSSMGQPFRDTRRDAPGIAERMRYWAGMADKILGVEHPVVPGVLSYTKRDPLGVMGVIIPWNGPISSFVNRTSAALACGNAVVLKPSEFAPLSALRLGELALEAGLPAGLVNVVTGDGSTGGLITQHPGVTGVSFTGSVATGKLVGAQAGGALKKVVLELGGKSPTIVFADADLDEALRAAVWGVFHNTGQACLAGTRVLVERSVAAEFVDGLVERARRVRVGDPFDPDPHVGPVVSERQYERVTEYFEIGRQEGAEVALGGGRPADREDAPGFYVAPTIFTGVEPGMRIAREEIFGPVLSVLAFDDEAEALALANDVDYGLSASIWTADVGRMLRLADALESGTIFGNHARLLHPALPFGGFKDSGVGNASGEGAIEGNTRLKRVSIRYGTGVASPGWGDV